LGIPIGLQTHANFGELRKAEVRRISLPHTALNDTLGYVRSSRAGKIKLVTHIGERKDSSILMSEQRSFWQKLFGRTGSSSLSPRQQKVSDYIIARMEKDVPFRQVLTEDYVRRNSSQAEIERIISSPEFIETARERLGETFRSEEFRL
jgi:hypothetical protein